MFENDTILDFSGIQEPLIIVRPNNKSSNIENSIPKIESRKNDSLVSLLDIMPTILDWHNIRISNSLTGKSLLPYLGE